MPRNPKASVGPGLPAEAALLGSAGLRGLAAGAVPELALLTPCSFLRLPAVGRGPSGVSAITVNDCLQLGINLSKGLRSGARVLGGSAKFLKTFLFSLQNVK